MKNSDQLSLVHSQGQLPMILSHEWNGNKIYKRNYMKCV